MSLCLTPAIERITAEVTGRSRSLFAADVARHGDALGQAVTGTRVLVAGGAGSIGSATILELLALEPAALCVLDPSENNLAELLRTIRSREPAYRGELHIEPLDYGSLLARRFLSEARPFDWVLSVAALKHVRSERDAVSALRMLEINLLAADRFLATVRMQGHGARGLFMVSTDKAAQPVSLMGAGKRAMELLLWAHRAGGPASLLDGGDAPPLARASTARFANVAFSDGSLPWSFLQRLAKEQPLSLPGDVRRYLVSPREAGQLCLLAAVLAPDRTVVVPRLSPERDLVDFKRVAEATLKAAALVPAYYDDEASARAAVARERSQGRYPVLLTRSDTSGEKEVEVFVAEGESVSECDLDGALAIAAPDRSEGGLAELLALIHAACVEGRAIDKPELSRALAALVPDFEHHETGRSLDAKM